MKLMALGIGNEQALDPAVDFLEAVGNRSYFRDDLGEHELR